MQLLYYPHPRLRKRTRTVPDPGQELNTIVRNMFSVMYAARTIGLAANQVGLNLKCFVSNLSGDPRRTEEEKVFIDPHIVSMRGEQVLEEGCASLPGTSLEESALPLSYLYHHHLAPPYLCARALPDRYIEMAQMPAEAIDRRAALARIPHGDDSLFSSELVSKHDPTGASPNTANFSRFEDENATPASGYRLRVIAASLIGVKQGETGSAPTLGPEARPPSRSSTLITQGSPNHARELNPDRGRDPFRQRARV